uniref:Putative LOC100897181 [Metaseiulus occidentalis] n=1 Tax=Lepeophtheirus salmonis TaxID=72036 RepID=A0A0K2UZI8_LEPSM
MILHVTSLVHRVNRIATLCLDYFDNTNISSLK